LEKASVVELTTTGLEDLEVAALPSWKGRRTYLVRAVELGRYIPNGQCGYELRYKDNKLAIRYTTMGGPYQASRAAFVVSVPVALEQVYLACGAVR
jgi:hypothetical protein